MPAFGQRVCRREQSHPPKLHLRRDNFDGVDFRILNVRVEGDVELGVGDFQRDGCHVGRSDAACFGEQVQVLEYSRQATLKENIRRPAESIAS